MNRCLNVIVVGSGVAGMAFAHRLSVLAGKGEVDIRILSKAPPETSNSHAAQGGVAAVIDPTDSWEQHRDDTLVVGAGRCDPNVVEMVVREGPQCIQELLGFGARFDADADGSLNAAREGGHGAARIVHHQDSTGAELVRVLREQVERSDAIRIEEPMHAVDLLLDESGEQQRCCGVRVLDLDTGRITDRHADVVVLATGGAGQVFMHTTNPPGATGSGVAMAVRAGVDLRDMAFVQFHPTALYTPDPGTVFLISEAVRGAGAILLKPNGERLMAGIHPSGDLAPRNVVARAIHATMRSTGAPHVRLDARSIGRTRFIHEFPTIYDHCRGMGIDPTTDLIPVMPAAHYLCGGIRTDAFGQSSLAGLLALGECACSGLHGADRLASNSLLEALVIPRSAATNVLATAWPERLRNDTEVGADRSDPQHGDHELTLLQLRNAMTTYLGLVRDRNGMAEGVRIISSVLQHADEAWARGDRSSALMDLRDLASVALAIANTARSEERNVGTHFNIDLVPSDAADRAKYNSFSASVRSSELTHFHHVRPLP